MNRLRDSTDLLGDDNALRSRMQVDGYLWLRSVIPPEPLDAVRKQIYKLLELDHWIDGQNDGRNAPKAVDGNACSDGDLRYSQLYKKIFALEDLHQLPHNSAILSVINALVGSDVLIHPRVVARLVFPNYPSSLAPPHQDHVTLRGSTETYVVWMPLTLFTPNLGGLALASGSHRCGILEVEQGWGVGGYKLSKHPELSWACAPVQFGDMLVFHSLMVHKSLPVNGSSMRLSVDARYQSRTDPIHPAAFALLDGRSWEHTYSNWKSDSLRYYWRGQSLRLSPDRDFLHRLAVSSIKPEAARWAKEVLAAVEGILDPNV